MGYTALTNCILRDMQLSFFIFFLIYMDSKLRSYPCLRLGAHPISCEQTQNSKAMAMDIIQGCSQY